MEILIGALLVLLVAVGILVFWLSRSRSSEVKAEAEADSLKKAQEVRREGDKIMAEPVADEDAWLREARERAAAAQHRARKLRDAKRQ